MKQLCDFFHFSIGTKMILFLILFSCFSVDAQTKSAQPSAGKQQNERRTNLNFEDELVEGATQKPELFYLFQQKNFNYKRLIKLRENFRPEMRKTTEDIQRIRSEN